MPILVIRANGSLARRIDFVGGPAVGATNSKVAGFVEDQWSPLSYVHSQALGNLNDFVSLFGTTRDPIIRPDESSRQPLDAPN